MPYDVLIIGAGTKGALYDRPGDLETLSHAKAFSDHPAFNICGFVDCDGEKAVDACKRWGVEKAFNGLGGIYEKPDVLVVATPEDTHAQVLQGIYDLLPVHRPKLIVCEKPFCNSNEDAWRLMDLFENQAKISIQVNYSRRFVNSLRHLVTQIYEGHFGELLSGFGVYTKGWHNLSHMTDFCSWADILPNKVNLQEIDREKLNAFELTLYFEKAKIELINQFSEVKITGVKARKSFVKDFILENSTEIYSTQLQNAMPNMVQNCFEFLENESGLLCPITRAIEAYKWAEEYELRT